MKNALLFLLLTVCVQSLAMNDAQRQQCQQQQQQYAQQRQQDAQRAADNARASGQAIYPTNTMPYLSSISATSAYHYNTTKR